MSGDSPTPPPDAATGGCGCGAVRWRISQPPLGAAYCHCTRCQRRTGSGSSLQALVAPGSFEITRGEDAVGTWRPDGGWPKCFCRECGSAVFGRHPERPEVVIVRLGSFDEDPGVKVHYRQFVGSAPAWDTIPEDGLPRFEGRAPSGG